MKIPVAIDNVSAGGCAIRPIEDGPALDWRINDTSGRLWVEPMGELVKNETLPITVKHISNQNGLMQYGCEFSELHAEEYYVLADLMYADSDALPRFLRSRRNHKNVFAGTWQLVFWGMVEPFRALAYLAKKPPVETPAVEEKKPAEIPQVETTWLRKIVAIANKDTPPPAKASATDAKVA